MKALLLVAHGSRLQSSNEEVQALTERLHQQAGESFDLTRYAFLELAEPSIPQGIQQCIDQGAAQVVVLPYFLSAGRHVSEDIPAEVATKQSEHPGIDIQLAPYVGANEGMIGLLLETAR